MRGTVGRVVADRTARRRVDVVRVVLTDETGAVEAVWFNQRYLVKVLAEGMRLSVRGTYRPQGGRSVVRREEPRDPRRRGGRLRPHRGHRARVSRPASRCRRGCCAASCGTCGRRCAGSPTRCPPRSARARALPTRADATVAVHLPRDLDEAAVARARLVLEELLLMQVGLLLHKGEQQRRAAAPALAAPSDLSGPSSRVCRSS